MPIEKSTIGEIRADPALYEWMDSHAIKGYMFQHLLRGKVNGRASDDESLVYIYYSETDEIWGWSFVFDYPWETCPNIGVYVLPDYRRKGIGKLLRNAILEDNPGEFYCQPGNRAGFLTYHDEPRLRIRASQLKTPEYEQARRERSKLYRHAVSVRSHARRKRR